MTTYNFKTHASPVPAVRNHVTHIQKTAKPVTRMGKGRNGWECDTDLTLFGNHILNIQTRKASRGGIYSSASVGVREGHFMSHRMYRDFRVIVDQRPDMRCTEKNVEKLHDEATARMAEIVTKALEHYAKMEELPEEPGAVTPEGDAEDPE